MEYRQHGDVLVKKITEIPKDAEAIKTKILAEGEATGHAHRLYGGNALVYMAGAIMYLRVLKEVQLRHEEHKALYIPEGDYVIDKVREYDHFLEEVREVMD